MTHKTQWMLALASIVLMASCASTNPPNQKLTETDMVIQAAEAACSKTARLNTTTDDT